MKLDGKSVLHAVYDNTRFSAARFLTGESSNDIWEALLCMWVALRVGYTDVLGLNEETQFPSTELLILASVAVIFIKPSGVESHNSISVC